MPGFFVGRCGWGSRIPALTHRIVGGVPEPALTEVDGGYALTAGDESEHHFPPDPVAAAVRTKTLSAICMSVCLHFWSASFASLAAIFSARAATSPLSGSWTD